MSERRVYVVTHSHSLSDHVDSKFIGVFSALQQASDAVTQLRQAEGFKDSQEGFSIQELTVDRLNDSKI